MKVLRFTVYVLLLLALLVLPAALVLAQSGGGYDLSWWTVDGGGSTVSAGGYVLDGSIGQPDASVPIVGGGYALTGGFWAGGAERHRIYTPLILK